MKEEYNNSVEKVEYFLGLSDADKWNLYNELERSSQQELLDELSIRELKDFLDSLDKNDKHEIFKRLSSDKLKAIYKIASENDKNDIIQFMENNQIELNRVVDESRENIQISMSNMTRSDESIKRSTDNIRNIKEDIKQEKQILKNQKIVLKKLERERKKNLKKVLRAKKKLTSPLNRIGIISKYRMRKYLDRINELEQTNQKIDVQKFENVQIKQKIERLNNDIVREKMNIIEERKKIDNEKHNINLNVSRLGRAEVNIKKLSKMEKKVMGRKLYNKVLFERDCVMVRKKKKVVEKTEIKQEQKIEKVEKVEKVEVLDYKNNTEVQVKNTLNGISKLGEMGVNFYPPSVRLGNVVGANLLSGPVMQISQEQLVAMAYVMAYVYNLSMQQQMMQQQNLNNGYSRTLSKGFANLTLLTSIIFFGIGLVLFLLS